MKYIVVLGDGMADFKIPRLSGKTCLEYAKTPNLDKLAPLSEIGLCKTVPDGFAPASDVANMSVLGFDPNRYYTGRSPLEAVAMGIKLGEKDVTYRCNLVTLSDGDIFKERVMLDYSAGEISTGEAKELIKSLKKELDGDIFKFYAGVSYKHCLVMKDGGTGHALTPPHDIPDKRIGNFLPKGRYGKELLSLMERSCGILNDHPVNLKRIKDGKKPANCIWLWGEGTKPALESFEKLHGLKGGMISAVDLLKGIAALSGLRTLKVDGATGNYDTDFAGKANAAADALSDGLDFVYIHMEAPDECGHHGDIEHKVKSIEMIDGCVIKTIAERLSAAKQDFAMLVLPDHPTPCALKTHVSDPVPYLLYSTKKSLYNGASRYTESEAEKTGAYVGVGHKLIEKLFAIK